MKTLSALLAALVALVVVIPAASEPAKREHRSCRGRSPASPGEPVPNEYYDRNESAHQLKYTVPANAHVTVIVNPG